MGAEKNRARKKGIQILEEQLIDARELARRLSVKLTTVWFWTRTTEIPRVKCGRLVRFNLAEVLGWFRKAGDTTRPVRRQRGGRARGAR